MKTALEKFAPHLIGRNVDEGTYQVVIAGNESLADSDPDIIGLACAISQLRSNQRRKSKRLRARLRGLVRG